MTNDKIQEATGIIEEVSEKESRHSFKLGGRTYSFFETKQDGENTKAWNKWQELSLKSGDIVVVAYKDTKSGKYTYHNALSFMLGSDKETENMMKKEKTTGEPDWDVIAEGKVRHGVVCAMIERGDNYNIIEEQMGKFVELIMGVKAENKSNVEEINPEDIPF